MVNEEFEKFDAIIRKHNTSHKVTIDYHIIRRLGWKDKDNVIVLIKKV